MLKNYNFLSCSFLHCGNEFRYFNLILFCSETDVNIFEHEYNIQTLKRLKKSLQINILFTYTNLSISLRPI